MDGRHIDHIETHLGNCGEKPLAIGEGAMSAGLSRSGTREELVPGTEAGALRINNDGEFAIGLGGKALVGVAEGNLVEDWIGGMEAERFGLLTRTKNGGALSQELGVCAGCTSRRLSDEIGADQIIDRRVGFSLNALQQIATPGLEVIDPALHFETVPAHVADAKCSGPTVIDKGLHGNLDPLVGALAMSLQRSGDGVVTVGEDVGFNSYQIAYGSFRREATAVDFGGDAFNDDPHSTVFGSDCHLGAVLFRVRIRRC